MNNKKVSIIVIIVLIIGAGYFIYANSLQPRPLCWPYCPGMTNQDREDIQKSAFEAETKDWKTYTNDSEKYSVKYPSSWFLDFSYPKFVFITSYDPSTRNSDLQTEPFSSHLNKQDIKIVISTFIRLASDVIIESIYADPKSWTDLLINPKLIYVDGMEAVTGEDGETSNIRRVILMNSGKAYLIDYTPLDSNLVDEFNKILSTFKFTK